MAHLNSFKIINVHLFIRLNEQYDSDVKVHFMCSMKTKHVQIVKSTENIQMICHMYNVSFLNRMSDKQKDENNFWSP